MTFGRPAPLTPIGLRAQLIALHGKAGKRDGADVIAGLTGQPKTLPARYFYDAAGSALFERITTLPEYYLTRAEIEILTQRAGEIAALTGPVEIVELGSGDARKAGLLLAAYEAGHAPLRYMPIDVSGAALRASTSGLAAAFPGIEITAIQGTFDLALAWLGPPQGPARMVTFLGSTIGNLDQPECDALLGAVRRAIAPAGFFLVGLDLRKDRRVIEAAYSDKAQVTAAFNRNILRVINRRFRADFVPERFVHRAYYAEDRHRIEMHLYSPLAQEVRLSALGMEIGLSAGESIRTEISRKFDLDTFAADACRHGLSEVARYRDEERRFGMLLLDVTRP
jgi:dimethylhistidine N-methyltransferase